MLRWIYIVALTAVLAVLLIPAQALAGSLSIEPLRQELTLSPGQAFTSSLQVRNNMPQTAEVQLSAEAFNVTDENYDYSFASFEKINDWLSFDRPQLGLPPQASGQTAYTLSIPTSAEPGEKYIALFASVKNQSQNSVATIDRVGLLLYITIAGNVTKHASVIELHIPSFSTSSKPIWNIRLHSTGSAHFSSKVTVTSVGLFGNTTGETQMNHLILPNTIRLLSGSVDLSHMPGLYRIRFLIGQGDDPPFRQTRWILYIPVWFMVLVVVCATLVAARLRQNKTRKRNHSV